MCRNRTKAAPSEALRRPGSGHSATALYSPVVANWRMGAQVDLRQVKATRYVTPLREGGSLPAIIEADDDGLYVLKFRGAGQGPKALVAELVSGEIGRALGLPVPEIVLVDLDPDLANAEPDFEIQDLLKRSGGLNLALDFLPGSLAFAPARPPKIDPAMAAATVWFDAYVMNVDRSPRNPNLVVWNHAPWLIDHGASLYFQHDWANAEARVASPFAQSRDHILLPFATSITEADRILRTQVTPELLRDILAAVPDSWLEGEGEDATAAETRNRFADFLTRRLAQSQVFSEEAERARTRL